MKPPAIYSLHILSSFKILKTFILNEIRLMSLMYWHYKLSSFVNVLMIAADFIWWMLLIDGGNISPAKIAPLLMGYLLWAYAYYFIYDSHYFISENSQTGVLEQIYLSPYPFYYKLLARFASGVIFCTMELSVVLTVILLFFPVTIPVNAAAVLIFLITLIGIAGFSLIIAGIGLVFKKSQPFAYLMNNLLLFFNGSILPIENLPIWLQFFSKSLPTTQGIIVLREVTFGNKNLVDTFASGSLVLLVINSVFYLFLGWYIFTMCENRAQDAGSLGHY